MGARPPAAGAAAHRERRQQARHELDTSATILLVNVGSTLQGRILDLSLNGCRIRTDERFPVGIYTRVETEFRLQGLPFRLGGVIQAIHDRNTVGIRFLDLSERKRKQVLELIGEIEQLHADRRSQPHGDGARPEAGESPPVRRRAAVESAITAAIGGAVGCAAASVGRQVDLDVVERRRIVAVGHAFHAQHVARLQLDASSIGVQREPR